MSVFACCEHSSSVFGKGKRTKYAPVRRKTGLGINTIFVDHPKGSPGLLAGLRSVVCEERLSTGLRANSEVQARDGESDSQLPKAKV